ncbi:MAG: DNA methyltransferase [Candidatus Ratteibacteria bacterium]|jgi:DNA modification methylase
MGKLNWQTEKRKVNDLKLFNGNPRKMTEKQAGDLIKSLKKFGVVEIPVIDQNNRIIAGNMRVTALQKLDRGMDEIDVRVPNRDLTEEEAREYLLRSNRNTGEWDFDTLANFDEELLKNVGFDSNELDGIFQLEDKPEDDYVPETRPKTDIKFGDIFQLGEHRLLCGDATNAEDAEKLMQKEKANIVFTSPPYWVGFEYENEKDKDGILAHINKSAFVMGIITKGKVVINTGNINSITIAEKITGKKQPALLIDWWIEALNKNNFLLRHIRIWAKNGGVMPSRRNDKIDMHWEYLATFTEENGNAGFIATFKNVADDTGINTGTPEWAVKGVWTDIMGAARQSGHCAAFPVELPSRYLKMYTERGNIVYEPYGGSGTTLIACEKLNRKCRMMEIDALYCQVIIDRWEEYTGFKAKCLTKT